MSMKVWFFTPLLMLALGGTAISMPTYDVSGVSIGMGASRIRLALGWNKPARFSDIPENGLTACAGGDVYKLAMKKGRLVGVQGRILRSNGVPLAAQGTSRKDIRKLLGRPARFGKDCDNYDLGNLTLNVLYGPSEQTAQSFVLTKVGMATTDFN